MFLFLFFCLLFDGREAGKEKGDRERQRKKVVGRVTEKDREVRYQLLMRMSINENFHVAGDYIN